MSMEIKEKHLILSQAPHIHSSQNVTVIMWIVFASLMPAAINSVMIFGTNALIIMLLSVAAAILAELLIRLFLKRSLTIHNGSAAVTGLLMAMNVPPQSAWWLAPIGSFFAIIIVKELFGGLGFNIFNPALAARAFLMASWPAEMTTKWFTFKNGSILSGNIDMVSSASISQNAIDAISGATPLQSLKAVPAIAAQTGLDPAEMYHVLISNNMLKSLAWGNIGGVIGETSAIMLLIGGAILLLTKIIKWHIPAAYIGTFSIIILTYYSVTGFDVPLKMLLFHLLSGGLMLGAFFMATDMVTAPITEKGMIIFGAGCGILTAIIRLYGGYPEGVCYSILLMNAVVPLIDRYIKPKVFGTTGK